MAGSLLSEHRCRPIVTQNLFEIIRALKKEGLTMLLAQVRRAYRGL